ncbi:MAG: ribosomal-processing cysteine protease Prp [Clostridia bacterium]
MIKFKVEKSESGKIVSIEVNGHSGYAECGSDIVCAAVSTAVQMTLNGIEEMKLADISYSVNDGYLVCEIPEDREYGADLLLNSLMITIYEIAKQYKKYLFILEV